MTSETIHYAVVRLLGDIRSNLWVKGDYAKMVGRLQATRFTVASLITSLIEVANMKPSAFGATSEVPVYPSRYVKRHLHYLYKTLRDNGFDVDPDTLPEPEKPIDIIKAVEAARSLARAIHAGQYRNDGTTPYLHHVAAVVKRVGDSPYLQAIAWLHDVVEDGVITIDTLRGNKAFDARIIDGVDAMTKPPGMGYIQYIKDKVAGNPDAVLVKIADIKANIGDDPTLRALGKYAKALEILVPLAERTK